MKRRTWYSRTSATGGSGRADWLGVAPKCWATATWPACGLMNFNRPPGDRRPAGCPKLYTAGVDDPMRLLACRSMCRFSCASAAVGACASMLSSCPCVIAFDEARRLAVAAAAARLAPKLRQFPSSYRLPAGVELPRLLMLAPDRPRAVDKEATMHAPPRPTVGSANAADHRHDHDHDGASRQALKAPSHVARWPLFAPLTRFFLY